MKFPTIYVFSHAKFHFCQCRSFGFIALKTMKIWIMAYKFAYKVKIPCADLTKFSTLIYSHRGMVSVMWHVLEINFLVTAM